MKSCFTELIPNVDDKVETVFRGLILDHVLAIHFDQISVSIGRHVKTFVFVIKKASAIRDDRNVQSDRINVGLAIDVPRRLSAGCQSQNARASRIHA